VSTERRIHDDSSVLGCYAMSTGRQLQNKHNAFMYRVTQYSFWNDEFSCIFSRSNLARTGGVSLSL